MGGQPGRDVLLKLADDGEPPAFQIVAGIRTKALALNARLIDSTSGESTAAWRELIAGAGVKSAEVAGAGVFKDAPSDAAIRSAFFAQESRLWRLVIPDFGTIEGRFVVQRLEYSGEHDGEAAFAITLASSGPLTFTEA